MVVERPSYHSHEVLDDWNGYGARLHAHRPDDDGHTHPGWGPAQRDAASEQADIVAGFLAEDADDSLPPEAG
jgi:hypothetical protein